MKIIYSLLCLFIPFSALCAKNTSINDRIAIIEIDKASLRYFGKVPIEREKIVSLVNILKKFDPATIFIDIFFIHPPNNESEKQFASDLNRDIPVITDFILSYSNVKINYFENKENLLTRIRAIYVSNNPNFLPFKGIMLPYPELVEKNLCTCAAFCTYFDSKTFKPMLHPFGYYDGYLFENSPITILNSYLYQINLNIDLSRDFLSLNLYCTTNNSRTFVKTIFSRSNLSNPLQYPIVFSKIKTYSAEDIIKNKIIFDRNMIFLIGYSADTDQDNIKTTYGVKSGTYLIACSMSTIINLIEKNNIIRTR